ncbi:hypothetical protein AcV5_002686 [Taiwanofungus camphoratus]|nr:hypothetical protein AcV5_002686 [Antrodia cinnamomea]KAI0924905.1 hypothetical protein AcW2_005641 [Antrodia cinnamomea]KAI0947035.1 hypothetical protein AcV7_009585 [Antrodia cinnamomea]
MLAERYAFSSIASFSLVSYQFRQTAFRRFFASLYARSVTYWNHCCRVPGVFSWVRNFKSSSPILTQQVHLLSQFEDLRAVEIDFSPDGLATQNNRTKLILTHLPAFTLVELRMTFLPSINTRLLTLIASTFANLKTLELTCTERLDEQCCWLCYEESSTCVIHSPIPDIYATVEDLSIAFATALRPLKKLTNVFFGIFLSDLDVFLTHILHREVIQLVLTADINMACGPDSCFICAGDYAAEVRARELIASVSVARILESLETITWSTFFATDQPGDNAAARSTTTWIRRQEGKVQVRRAPW